MSKLSKEEIKEMLKYFWEQAQLGTKDFDKESLVLVTLFYSLQNLTPKGE